MKTQIEFKNRAWMQFKKHVALSASLLLFCIGAINDSAQTYTVLHHFGPRFTDGTWPYAGLLLSGTNLYGTTHGDAIGEGSCIFKINTDGSGYTVFTGMGDNPGINPKSTLVQSGAWLYGTTSSGGFSNCGTLFQLSIDFSNLHVLKQFGGGDGAHPQGDLAVSDYYGGVCGVCSNGGTIGQYGYCGTAYSCGTSGNSYILLRDFGMWGGGYGANPVGGVTRSGQILYWTTQSGNWTCPYGSSLLDCL